MPILAWELNTRLMKNGALQQAVLSIVTTQTRVIWVPTISLGKWGISGWVWWAVHSMDTPKHFKADGFQLCCPLQAGKVVALV